MDKDYTNMQTATPADANANPNVKHYTTDDVRRLRELAREGCSVLQEVQDLKDGLSDTVKGIAEELDIKPSLLNKAIRTMHKDSLHADQEDFDIVVDIIETVGMKNQ